MPAPRHLGRSGVASAPLLRSLLLVAVAGYAAGAATTTPFTWPADVVTALPIGALLVAVCWRWPLHPRRTGAPPGRDGRDEQAERTSARALAGWVALLAVVVAWELVEYFARGPRGAHPTLSSMADALDRHTALKAVVFAAWLLLGAWIVRAGTRGRVSAPPS